MTVIRQYLELGHAEAVPKNLPMYRDRAISTPLRDSTTASRFPGHSERLEELSIWCALLGWSKETLAITQVIIMQGAGKVQTRK